MRRAIRRSTRSSLLEIGPPQRRRTPPEPWQFHLILPKPPKWFEGWPITRDELEPHYDVVRQFLTPAQYPEPYRDEPKTQAFRESLDNLKVDKGALLVEVANHGNRNLTLSSRNLAGIELVASSEVHPYHLLRYDRAIFSQPALQKLQESLKATAPAKKAEVA